jgi:V-type H+-transporting ATPase subunit A
LLILQKIHGKAMVLRAQQCKVGYEGLVGEVIRIEADKATIQVYEETGTALTYQFVWRDADSVSLQLVSLLEIL